MADIEETRCQLETLRHARCNLVGAVLNRARVELAAAGCRQLFAAQRAALASVPDSPLAATPMVSILG